MIVYTVETVHPGCDQAPFTGREIVGIHRAFTSRHEADAHLATLGSDRFAAWRKIRNIVALRVREVDTAPVA